MLLTMPWAEWIDSKTNIFRNKCDCQKNIERDWLRVEKKRESEWNKEMEIENENCLSVASNKIDCINCCDWQQFNHNLSYCTWCIILSHNTSWKKHITTTTPLKLKFTEALCTENGSYNTTKAVNYVPLNGSIPEI